MAFYLVMTTCVFISLADMAALVLSLLTTHMLSTMKNVQTILTSKQSSLTSSYHTYLDLLTLR